MRAILSAVLILAASAVSAQAPIQSGVISDVKVEASSLSAKIEFSGPSSLATGSSGATVSLDIELEFESVIGLSLSSLGLSADLIDPVDPNLLARLPVGRPISIPAAFPVLLTIEPPSTGPLSFTGTYSLEIHTHNLSYQGLSPLRLLRSPLGGEFQDVTSLTAAGSYRARGTDGGFSQFLIGSDTTAVDSVIADKLARLGGELAVLCDLFATDIYDDLLAILDDIEWQWSNHQLAAAIDSVDDFVATIVEHSGGDEIPDVWRSSRDLTNVAGTLRGSALTLRFSLSQKANGAL